MRQRRSNFKDLDCDSDFSQTALSTRVSVLVRAGDWGGYLASYTFRCYRFLEFPEHSFEFLYNPNNQLKVCNFYQGSRELRGSVETTFLQARIVTGRLKVRCPSKVVVSQIRGTPV